MLDPSSSLPSAAVDPGSSALLAYDRQHLWHPYTSMTEPMPATLVTEAEGVHITTADGDTLIDAMSSWWCAVNGYRHPVLDRALRTQAATMAHVMFGGLTHQPAVDLGAALIERAPDPLEHVFFADSGSVSVEVALKMALQYQRGKGRSGKTRMLALSGGYHGDTAGAMSVCDPISGMHSMFTDVLPRQVFAPRPPAGYAVDISHWAAQTEELVRQYRNELAAIICEPVLQGAGGMHVYSPHCLEVLRRLADEHDLVLIFDEIATGFGRTGRYFAAEHAGISPDIMCVGKALSGGYLTLAATLCTSEVAAGIGQSESGVLMHGPTFMANPLACAVALANVQLLDDRGWQADVQRIEAALFRGLAPAASMLGVADVRVQGAVGVIQLDRSVDVQAATRAARDLGVWVRPFRDLIYTMPPYITDTEDLTTICTAMIAAATV